MKHMSSECEKPGSTPQSPHHARDGVYVYICNTCAAVARWETRDNLRSSKASQPTLQNGKQEVCLQVKGKDRLLKSSNLHMSAMANVDLHPQEHTTPTHTQVASRKTLAWYSD